MKINVHELLTYQISQNFGYSLHVVQCTDITVGMIFILIFSNVVGTVRKNLSSHSDILSQHARGPLLISAVNVVSGSYRN